MTSSNQVLHFTCTACGSPLTVPAHMAGVSGPCPKCGTTITSPQNTPPPAAPLYPPAPQVQIPAMPAPLPPVAPPVQQPAAVPVTQSPPMSAGHGGGVWPTNQALPQQQVAPPEQATHYSPPAQQLPQNHPALGGVGMPAARGTSPIMSGPWPPNAQAHPVLSSLLQSNVSLADATTRPAQASPAGANQQSPTNTLPTPLGNRTAITPHQQQPAAPITQRPVSRRSSAPSGDKRRGVFMMGALLMALLTIAGASWFFQDQIKAAWRMHNMANSPDQDPATVNTGTRVTKPEEPAVKTPPQLTVKPAEPTAPTFNPEAPPRKALPVNPDTSLSETPSSSNNQPPSLLRNPSPPVMVPDPSVPTTKSPDPLVEVPPAPGTIPKAVPVPTEPTVKATPETQAAVEVLKKFFAAKTWRDRLKLVQLPDQLEPNMEEYYASNPDGPITISHIELLRHDKAPQQGVPHCVFEVSGPGLEGSLPIMVEDSKDGYKVDWLTFTEFKDKLLLKFGQAFTERPARFHVMVRRTHYFDDDVPQMDKKQCFELQPPMPGFTVNVFASKGTPLAKELDRNLGWEVANAAAIVELQWRKQDNYQWIELVNVPQYHWRTMPPGEQPAFKQAPEQK